MVNSLKIVSQTFMTVQLRKFISNEDQMLEVSGVSRFYVTGANEPYKSKLMPGYARHSLFRRLCLKLTVFYTRKLEKNFQIIRDLSDIFFSYCFCFKLMISHYEN